MRAAALLMDATSANNGVISERVLADLISDLGLDFGFVRHNDHEIHATVLVASWPPRENVPDPDPIGVIYFADADSVFAQAEHLKDPVVVRPDPGNADYQRNIEEGIGVPAVSLACVPLLSADITTGTLGFGKFGDREWLPEELNALQTIAMMLAQVPARIVAEDQIHYLYEHDDLTGLINRRALIAHLDKRLAKRKPGPVAVLFVDLDRFKSVNDHFGQSAGDAFIEAFATQLREAIDIPATIASLGGDEFVIVPAARMDAEAAVAFAESLHHRLHRQVMIDGELLTRTVSIGVATGQPGRDSPSDLLLRVDQATREAKSFGGAMVATFTPEMSRNNQIRNDIELHLEGILDSDSGTLLLQYLPEVDLRTGEIVGTEALLRWQHPTFGLLMPESFMGVLSIKLATKLGRIVMRSACAQFARWHSRGIGLDAVLGINVSPGQLVTGGIVDTVADTLQEFDLNPDALRLEITESVVVQDIDAARKSLFGLKDLGVRIAIDDFGTGYSVLTYLKSLPVDTLKIGRGFVRSIDTNVSDLAIVRSIMALADGLELRVVAQGVDTVRAAETLLDLGCYRAQGFLLSPAVDSGDMGLLLTRGAVPISVKSRAKAP